MPLEIKECLDIEEAEYSGSPVKGKPLRVVIEALHAYPVATRNYTRYSPECLRESVSSWTKPYKRPLICHHNTKDGKVIGRVVDAYYIEHSKRSDSPALGLIVDVIDEEAKQQVVDGRLDTVSVGAIIHDARCSICGKQLSNGDVSEHEHKRGETYDIDGEQQTCYWDFYKMEGKEVSYVVVPADIYAGTVEILSSPGSSPLSDIKESYEEPQRKGEKDMDFEKELKELKAKLAAAEAENAELKKKVESANLLAEEKQTLEQKVAELDEVKKSMEESAKENDQLKEGLENELSEAKLQAKESMIETLQIMRKALGKSELDAEKVKERSTDSIRDSIMDMKEDFDASLEKVTEEPEAKIEAKESAPEPQMPQPGSLKNPAVIDDNAGLDAKESAEEEKLDLRAGLEDLFSSVVNLRR